MGDDSGEAFEVGIGASELAGGVLEGFGLLGQCLGNAEATPAEKCGEQDDSADHATVEDEHPFGGRWWLEPISKDGQPAAGGGQCEQKTKPAGGGGQ